MLVLLVQGSQKIWFNILLLNLAQEVLKVILQVFFILLLVESLHLVILLISLHQLFSFMVTTSTGKDYKILQAEKWQAIRKSFTSQQMGYLSEAEK